MKPCGAQAEEGGSADRKRRAEMAPVGAGLLTKKKKTGKAGKQASSLINKWQAVRKVPFNTQIES